MDEPQKDTKENPTVYRTWDDGYLVRAMTPEDAKIVQKWYSGMGNITTFDLDVALSVFPPGGGFYIGELNGEVVASGLRIPWGKVFYGSAYYVEEKHRGKGYGTRLRDQVAREYVGDNILCVDSVPGKVVETNKKLGYKGAFSTHRYHGKSNPHIETSYSGKIVQIKEVPFDKIIAYDNKVFLAPDVPVRKAFIKKWTGEGGQTLVALDRDGNIEGYGTIHPCVHEKEHLVAPLYADNAEIAESLLQRLCALIPEDSITITFWTRNEAALNMMKKFGLQFEFEIQRMHLNGDPDEY